MTTDEEARAALEVALPCQSALRDPGTVCKIGYICNNCRARSAVWPLIERLVADAREECRTGHTVERQRIAALEERLAAAEAERDHLTTVVFHLDR